jgi:hypothetical protein
MKTITTQGTYTHEGASISFDFQYKAYDNVADAIADLGESKVLADLQRMVKLDAGNTSRAKAMAINGHSKVVVMSEEAKANAKLQRKADQELLKALKAKGLSVADIASL